MIFVYKKNKKWQKIIHVTQLLYSMNYFVKNKSFKKSQMQFVDLKKSFKESQMQFVDLKKVLRNVKPDELVLLSNSGEPVGVGRRVEVAAT